MIIITIKEDNLLRYSSQRELIKDIVKNNPTHLTAEGVYNLAKKIKPDISLGTVYRDLKVLVKSGEILTLETVDKKIRYDADKTPHVHAVCLGCGKITDVFVSVVPKELNDSGFTVMGEKCVYYGLCPDCKNKQK